jgi:TonB family protein
MRIQVKLAGTALLAIALISLFSATPSQAQTTVSAHTDRKLVYKVDPYYPTDLKRLFIGGVVRLKVVVSARGTVDTVTALGGNPALVDSSITAVKKWKYAPADNQTELLLNLDFDPRR